MLISIRSLPERTSCLPFVQGLRTGSMRAWDGAGAFHPFCITSRRWPVAHVDPKGLPAGGSCGESTGKRTSIFITIFK